MMELYFKYFEAMMGIFQDIPWWAYLLSGLPVTFAMIKLVQLLASRESNEWQKNLIQTLHNLDNHVKSGNEVMQQVSNVLTHHTESLKRIEDRQHKGITAAQDIILSQALTNKSVEQISSTIQNILLRGR